MTDSSPRPLDQREYLNYVALDVLKTLLAKLPIPGLPSGGGHYIGDNQFARQIVRDSFVVACEFMAESNRVSGGLPPGTAIMGENNR